jgi:hypothetical protein
MAIIKVKQIPHKKISSVDILGRFCYYFPQYTYSQARKLPYNRVMQLLRVVDREYAIRMIDLVNIVAAPHTDKGRLVNKLLEEFRGRV